MSTINVNADGSGDYTTIQAAVDAAVAGDTVLIANGVYVEQVTITTSDITLQGESRVGVIIRSPATPERQDPGFAAVIAVLDASGVTIDGLQVDGDRRLDEAFVAGAQDFFGILYIRSSGAVNEVDVSGVQGDNGFFGVQAGAGIGVLVDSDGRETFSLTDSTISGFQKTGLLTSGIDLTATGNTITGIGQTTLIGQNGMQLGGDTRGTVANNTIEGIGFDGPTTDEFDASAILVFDTTQNLSLTGNTLTGSSATDDTAVFLYDSAGVTVTGNTVSRFGVGIDFEDEPGAFLDIEPNALNVLAPNTLDDVTISLIFDPESDDFNASPTPRTDAFAVAGTDGNDDLRGSGGDDSLGGSDGADILTGRLGNDTYVTNGDEIIVEDADGGTDLVLSSATITLVANVENLTLTGPREIDGTGNSLDNVITGNVEDNVLAGGGGSDQFFGGGGSDFYFVDGGDTVFEAIGRGAADLVQSSVNFRLADAGEVENLILTGNDDIFGFGNGLDNLITGNSGNNRLKGSGGVDFLTGNAGADRLSGGKGADTFVFNSINDSGVTSVTEDKISDFTQGGSQRDTIALFRIDAVASTSANEAFTFIGTNEFTAAGQVRYFIDSGRTFVQLNTVSTADDAPEMEIQLFGSYTLTVGDFVF